MADIKDRAREYLAKNSEYSEVYGEFLVAVDTMTAMIEFAEQETKELKEQIAELEKESKALGERCLQLQKDKGELIDKVRELEKENAELKHIIATLRQEKDNISMHAKAMEVVAKTRSDQLTKAKEIIKDLLGSENTSCEEEMFFEIRQKAEQFLSEVEKWKK